MPPFLLPLISIVAGLIKAPGAAVVKVAEVAKVPGRKATVKETLIAYAILGALAAGAQHLGSSASGIQSAICSAPVQDVQAPELQDEL